jgi:thiol:disulfide interchange protein DsbA
MKLLTRLFLALTLGLAALTAGAQGGPQEGVQYKNVVPPQPTADRNKVEVIEFFWYACPHCFSMQPILDPWSKNHPVEVLYRRVPVAFGDAKIPHSRMYYVLEALGRVDELNMKAFNGIHLEKKMLITGEEQAEYFKQFGVDPAKYLDLYNSFSVQSKVRAAQQTWQNYQIDGTPTIAVDGRWVTSPSMAGSNKGAMVVVDDLVDRARKELLARKKPAPAAATPVKPVTQPPAKPATK